MGFRRGIPDWASSATVRPSSRGGAPRVARCVYGAARGPVTTAVFKTVCGAVILSWVGSTPMSLRQISLATPRGAFAAPARLQPYAARLRDGSEPCAGAGHRERYPRAGESSPLTAAGVANDDGAGVSRPRRRLLHVSRARFEAPRPRSYLTVSFLATLAAETLPAASLACAVTL